MIKRKLVLKTRFIRNIAETREGWMIAYRKTALLALAAVVFGRLFAAPFSALAQPVDGDAASGREIAAKRCSSCHRVLPMTLADRADPPSFQSVADMPSTTGISLNAFLHSDHNNMPNFIISSTELNDLIAYILSLRKH